MEDHVHLLARFGRTLTQAEWVKELQRVSNPVTPKREIQQCGATVYTFHGDLRLEKPDCTRLRFAS